MQFEEPIQLAVIKEPYDPKTQMLRSNNLLGCGGGATATGTETETGGWGDTDSDTDSD